MLKRPALSLLCFSLTILQAGVAAGEPTPTLALPKDAVPAPAATYTFDKDPLGKPPALFTLPAPDQARGESWAVQRVSDAPSLPQALLHKSAGLSHEANALLLFNGAARDHGEIAVRFKTLSTDGDQTAGVVFRYQDPQNYWFLAFSSSHDTGSLFQVKAGKAKLIDSKEVIITPYKWHVLNLVYTDGNYTALLNQELLLGGKTKRVSTAGGLGLFCASSSSIAFDDFRISR